MIIFHRNSHSYEMMDAITKQWEFVNGIRIVFNHVSMRDIVGFL